MKKSKLKFKPKINKVEDKNYENTPDTSKKQTENVVTNPIIEESNVRSFIDVLKLVKNNWILIVLFGCLSFLIYSQSIGGQFLNIDDRAGIVYNPLVLDLNKAIETKSPYTIYQALIVKIFGLNSTMFHIGSISLHTIITFLVFVFSYVVFGRKISIIATLLFTTHPVNVEAVCWLSAAGYLHQAIIVLICLLFFSLYRKSDQKKYLAIVVIIYGISVYLYKTPWVLVMPFLIVVLDQLFFSQKIEYKKIWIYVPFLIISAIYVYTFTTSAFENRAVTLKRQHYLDINDATPYINRIPYVVYMMCSLYILPLVLTIYHEGTIIGNTLYTLMIVTTILYAVAIIKLWKNKRTIAALMIMIPTCTLPSYSPVAIVWLCAERYLYLGTVFYSILLVILLSNLERITKIKNISKYLLGIIIILYSAKTFVRAGDFKDSKSLWLSTRTAAPLSYRVYNNLGDVYAEEGQYELAIENFKRSLELKPNYADAVHNLGFTYMQMNDAENAKKFLALSFQMNPYLYQSLYKLAYIYFVEGNYDMAIQYANQTLQVAPESIDAKNMLIEIEKIKSQGNTYQNNPQMIQVPIESTSTKKTN